MGIVEGTILDEGGAVFNVKAYGALGNGGTGVTDRNAVLAAIAAANAFQVLTNEQTASGGKGAVVYFPPGVYRCEITASIGLSSGVTLRGSGMRTSQIVLVGTTSIDGLVWNQGSETVFFVGGGLEDIDVSSSYQIRDAVVLRKQQNFHIRRARIRGASQHNLRIEDSLHFSATHLFSEVAGKSNLFIGPAQGQAGYSTTCSFFGCHFQHSQGAPGADVCGHAIDFHSCIFESSGSGTGHVDGKGILARWGTIALYSPYFENNFHHDVHFGTETGPTGSPVSSITITNPLLFANGQKVAGAKAMRFERGVVTLLGGNYSHSPAYKVSFAAPGAGGIQRVFLLAETYAQEPEVDAPGTVDSLPGVVYYTVAATGQNVVSGLSGYRIGGGELIKKHLSVLDSADWTPNGGASLAHGSAVTRTDISVPGARAGNTVVVSFNHKAGGVYAGLGGGVVLFGSVSATDKVTVTLLNVSGGALTFGPGRLRVDVWQHTAEAV
jgi:hypothetical protein